MKDNAITDYGVVTDAGTVRLERILPGPIERVWSYLTESEKRGQWFAAGEMELRVGGRGSSASTTPSSRRNLSRRPSGTRSTKGRALPAASRAANHRAC